MADSSPCFSAPLIVQAMVQWANRVADGLCQTPDTHSVEQLNSDVTSSATKIATWLRSAQ